MSLFFSVFFFKFNFPFLAITNLSGVKVYGKDIKVTASKHHSVSMPKEGDVSKLLKCCVMELFRCVAPVLR